MAGFFDTSGMGPISDGTNNAAADFDRLNSANPSQFKNGFFERLFGRKPSKEELHAQQVTAAAPQDVPQSPTARLLPKAPPSSPKPAISSGAGLVARITSEATQPPRYDANGAALVPGTPFTPEQFAQQLMAAQHPITDQNQLPPFQGIPRFNGPPPPLRQTPPNLNPFPGGQTPVPPPQPGREMFGQSIFPGGQTPVPPSRRPFFGGSIFPQRQQMPPPSMNPQAFAEGGPLALRRGGYPANLMMGLPQRFDSGGESYVPPDGQGDGRSDHVPAVLSPGEFVMDAETVALLGNGDNSAGARKLEGIRKEIRRHKGKALAKGKFSPDSKSAGFYAKRAAGGK